MERGQTAIITNIQRFSLHDGPGIRTTVFLKGCNLHCAWCHNPENIAFEPQLLFDAGKCIGCLQCAGVCPEGAISKTGHGPLINRNMCKVCGACAEPCPSCALNVCGRSCTAREVMDEVLKDRDFYAASGGGVTLSGGEPLLHADFCKAVLLECKKERIGTAVETALNVPRSALETVIPVNNLFIVDIKTLRRETYLKYIGDCGRALENFEYLAAGCGVRIIVRTPVIPGVNDTVEELRQIREYVSAFKSVETYEPLQYHTLAGSKYKSLGIKNGELDIRPHSAEQFAELKRKVME